MIDPLNIFQDIKKEVLKMFPNVEVYAFGSRVRGTSHTGKWDFDILVIYKEEKIVAKVISDYLKPIFENKIDENNRNIKIDVWTISKTNSDKFISIMQSANNGINLL